VEDRLGIKVLLVEVFVYLVIMNHSIRITQDYICLFLHNIQRGNLKISWATYKVALIAFVVAFGIFWFLLRVGALDSEPSSSQLPISQVVCGIALLMCFFGFFLYAKVKGVEDCYEAFQPARLLPYVTLLVVVPSLIYPYALLQIVDVLESSKAEYLPVLESKLE